MAERLAQSVNTPSPFLLFSDNNITCDHRAAVFELEASNDSQIK